MRSRRARSSGERTSGPDRSDSALTRSLVSPLATSVTKSDCIVSRGPDRREYRAPVGRGEDALGEAAAIAPGDREVLELRAIDVGRHGAAFARRAGAGLEDARVTCIRGGGERGRLGRDGWGAHDASATRRERRASFMPRAIRRGALGRREDDVTECGQGDRVFFGEREDAMGLERGRVGIDGGRAATPGIQDSLHANDCATEGLAHGLPARGHRPRRASATRARRAALRRRRCP